MALQDADRSKLDGIVSQMQANKEPDSNIQFVVNDFKQKYDDGTEGARKNVFEQAAQGALNIGAAGLRSLTGLATGGTALAAKLAGKAGLFPKTMQKVEQGVQGFQQQGLDPAINTVMGAENPETTPIANAIGGGLPFLAAPEAKAPEAIEGALKASPILRTMFGMGKEAAVNAGVGASEAESEGKSPGAGALVGTVLGGGTGFLKEVAPSWLKLIAGQSKAQKNSLNPVTTEGARTALESGAIPFFRGAEGAADKVAKFLQKDNAMREGLMDKTGETINIDDVIAASRKALQADIVKSGKPILPEDAIAAEHYFDQYAQKARSNAQYQNGELPLSEAMKLKTASGENTKWKTSDVPGSGKPLASKTVYGQIKNGIENKMSLTPQADEFERVNSRMAQLAPLEEALQNKAASPGMTPWEVAADVAGTGLGVSGHPLGYLFPAYSVGRRLPGTAAAMFNSPKAALPLSASAPEWLKRLPPHLAALADSSAR